jgi:iron complex transport system substrate-binding protein
VADLIRAGIAVHAFNQRDVAGILAMIRTLGALVGAPEKGAELAKTLAQGIEPTHVPAGTPRPRVWFEEWDEPLISGIGWASELIHRAGGEDAFAHLAREPSAKDRIVPPEAVIAAQPDVILASWCGKKVRPERIAARPGWGAIPAVRAGRIHEIKSPLILSPGPAALTEGFAAIRAAIAARWRPHDRDRRLPRPGRPGPVAHRGAVGRDAGLHPVEALAARAHGRVVAGAERTGGRALDRGRPRGRDGGLAAAGASARG